MAQGKISNPQNLSNNIYLHSNKFNFLNSLDARSLKTPNILNARIAELTDLYTKAVSREQDALNDILGVNATVEAFEQKYLIQDKNNKGKSKILEVVNRQEVVERIRNAIDLKQAVINLFEQTDIGTAWINETDSVRAILFTAFTKHGLKTSDDKSHKNIKDESSKIITRYLSDLKKTNLSNVLDISAIEQLADDIIIAVGSNWPLGLRKDHFKNRFIKGIQQSIQEGDFSSYSSGVGAILEVSLAALYNEMSRLGNEFDEQGHKLGTDLAIKGKSGKYYYFQLKNSFQNSGFANIKLHDSILLDSLISKIEISAQTANELRYALVNVLFLKQYGLNNQGKADNLSMRQVEETRDYIKLILNSLVYEFLGQKIVRAGETEASVSNYFFIYNGRYLIPISAFLKAAIIMLENVKNSISPITTNTLGAIQAPTLDSIANIDGVTFPNHHNLKAEKSEELQGLSKGLNYPQSLLAIGSAAGSNAAKTMRIRGLYYTMNISKIRNFIQNN